MAGKPLAIVALAISTLVGSRQAQAQQQPPPADPLTAKIDMSDVERFAALWKKTNGHPTAAQIDSEYIQGSGTGVKLLVPLRDLSGATMQAAIQKNPEVYQQALDKCAPWVLETNSDLRSIYLGLHGLLPEKPLPQIYVVIGRANTGGVPAPGAQLIGLETLCRVFPTHDAFRQEMRMVYAHETAHTFQRAQDRQMGEGSNPLLFDILIEGGADYVASLVTGSPPDSAREAFGRAHESEVWAQFVKDQPVANRNYKRAGSDGPEYVGAGKAAHAHWLFNGGLHRQTLPGWEPDMGYWLGMQIAKSYVERSADPNGAIRELLALEDADEILRKSGYGETFKP